MICERFDTVLCRPDGGDQCVWIVVQLIGKMLGVIHNSWYSLAFFFLVLFTVNVNADYFYNELKMVHVIFRHGEKTPSSASSAKFPKDPYSNYTFFPEGRGALTKDGKMSMYNLGTFLRKKYNDFLGNLYYPGVTRVRSSEQTRSMMSAQLVNAGLWPPSKAQLWNTDLPWIPIPYEYVAANTDRLMYSYNCPTYKNEYERVLQSEKFQERFKSHAEFIKYVNEYSGVNVTKPQDVFFLYHKLDAEKNCNLTLPAWTQGYFPSGEMYDVTLLEYEIANGSDLLRRIYGGPLLRDVLQDYNKWVENTSLGESDAKITLYSGHESSISSVLNSLRVWTPHVPDFSSAVIFELHLNNHTNEFRVTVLYHLGKSRNTIPLTIPGCTQLCPIHEFARLLSNVIPDDVDELCLRDVSSEGN